MNGIIIQFKKKAPPAALGHSFNHILRNFLAHQAYKQFVRPGAFKGKEHIRILDHVLVILQQVAQKSQALLLHPVASVANKTVHCIAPC